MSAEAGRAARSVQALATACLMSVAPVGVARAETLYDGIRLAYQTNPTLRAQQAQLRAIDETYIQALTAYGPQVNLSAAATYDTARVQQPGSLFGGPSSANFKATTESADLSLVQPLYTAGATRAQIRAARADVLSAREALRQAESQLIQNVVTAYVDVRRDRETLSILRDEIAALTREFGETTAKGAAGVLTRTDVAESEARLLSARGQLNLAQGRLEVSDAEYLNTIGRPPGDLAPEPELAGAPARIEEALDAAEANNPQLRGALDDELGARERVNGARSEFGPTIVLRADAALAPLAPYFPRQYDRSLTVAAVLNQPLFTSGLGTSRVREALERDNQAQLRIEATRRGVVQLVSQAWSAIVSTRGAIAIEARQVEIEQISVGGNRIEERVGQRSTIDLLNAELELANARLTLLQSRHDAYVAKAALLAAMGVLEARLLAPGGDTYDPQRSLARVERLGPPPPAALVGLADAIGAPDTPAPRLSESP